jgi:uncharacterized Zn-binding protein involved in type VI secretion
MKRSYMKVGDKSSAGGTVVEGIPKTTHNGAELTRHVRFVRRQATARTNTPAATRSSTAFSTDMRNLAATLWA